MCVCDLTVSGCVRVSGLCLCVCMSVWVCVYVSVCIRITCRVQEADSGRRSKMLLNIENSVYQSMAVRGVYDLTTICVLVTRKQ